MTRPAPTVTVPVEPDGVSPVYRAAHDSIRSGAPGLSDATCAVIARSINMKVAMLSAAPQAAGLGEPVETGNGPLYDLVHFLRPDFAEATKQHLARRTSDLLRAPSREPEGGAVSRDQVLAIVRQFASPSWCSVDRLVDTLFTALATREEAPAEAGEERLTAEQAWADLLEKDDRTSPEDRPDMLLITWEEMADYMARAQPPAREDAQPVGRKVAEDLIDIVEGIGGIQHGTWRDEKGMRLKDTPAWAAFYVAARNNTHPAPDALRDALADLASWFTKPVQGQNGMAWVIPAGEQGADDAVNAALAALQAEQKGGA